MQAYGYEVLRHRYSAGGDYSQFPLRHWRTDAPPNTDPSQQIETETPLEAITLDRFPLFGHLRINNCTNSLMISPTRTRAHLCNERIAAAPIRASSHRVLGRFWLSPRAGQSREYIAASLREFW